MSQRGIRMGGRILLAILFLTAQGGWGVIADNVTTVEPPIPNDQLWRLVAGSDIIVVGTLHGAPSTEYETRFVGITVKRVLKGRPWLRELVAFSWERCLPTEFLDGTNRGWPSRPVIAFIKVSDYSIHEELKRQKQFQRYQRIEAEVDWRNAGKDPRRFKFNAKAITEEDLRLHEERFCEVFFETRQGLWKCNDKRRRQVQEEIDWQKRYLQAFATSSEGRPDKFDETVRRIAEAMTLKRSQYEERWLLQELETNAIPAMVRAIDGQRRLAVPLEFGLPNPSFCGNASTYWAETVGEALEGLLTDYTGVYFDQLGLRFRSGCSYQKPLNSWRVWLWHYRHDAKPGLAPVDATRP